MFFLFYRLAENDVEEGPRCDITNLGVSGPITPTEQNLPQHYSLAIRSNGILMPTTISSQTASAMAKPDIITTTEPITLSVLSADIDDIVQHAFETWKNETAPNETLPFTNEEDFLLADLLQRSENEQQNLHLRSIG